MDDVDFIGNILEQFQVIDYISFLISATLDLSESLYRLTIASLTNNIQSVDFHFGRFNGLLGEYALEWAQKFSAVTITGAFVYDRYEMPRRFRKKHPKMAEQIDHIKRKGGLSL